ncbi:CBM35 domain-containing protein [Siphonobacter sp.]|uniref:CBM35 domain-containing protein n=1 Tax=Siphonobacter sp. TaxID=1869184 RepID=UPI003B3AAFB6
MIRTFIARQSFALWGLGLGLFSAPCFSQSVEVESGTLAGGAGIQNCESCSGQQMVGNLGTGSVTVPVQVTNAGTYRMTLSYATGDQRTINVTANQQAFVPITCPASGGWSNVATIDLRVTLQAGSNLITFDNPYGYGPNVDKFELSPLPTPLVQTIPFGTNSWIEYDLANGTYDVYFTNTKVVAEASARAHSNVVYRSNAGYTSRTYTSAPVTDRFGTGTRHVITLSGGSQLEMQQVFYTYPGRDEFYTEVLLNGPGSNCYQMSPLTSNAVDIQANADHRALFVPFDNDKWVRYEAKEHRYANFTSSEVGTLYDNTSRKGLIVGSVEHEVWKTGVNLAGEGRTQTSYVSVLAGWTNENVTRDKRGHGWVSVGQQSCRSPRILVNYANDWRQGLEVYGQANAIAEPRYVFNWTQATPLGWNSWGAIQSDLNLTKAKQVVDFFANEVPAFRNADQTLYVDLDSYWDNLTPGGMTGDFSQLTEFANYCKSKGLKPGIYWAPFVDWGKFNRTMEGSSYNYQDCWTKVNGQPLDLDGAYALDPTHPGTKARIAYLLNKFKASGFEMIKIDFLAHASLEADSFHESGVYTGMQAYKVGMEYLIDQLDGSMLVYAAISPNLATGRYAHMRRIACDAYKDISETAYTLNSTTYGWWQNQIYPFIDADHVVFANESEGENRARLASALVTGTLITGDDYASDGVWKARSQELLQNPDLLQVVADGKAFRPVEGNTGWDPNALFIKSVGNSHYLAIFNYGAEAKSFTIDLARVGLNAQQANQMKDLFSGSNLPSNTTAGSITLNVPAADVRLIQLRESALPVTLVNVEAKKVNRTTRLSWKTTAEVNNREFIIERSLDAKAFKPIGTVAGAGSSTKSIAYQFTDTTPILNQTNYYRLKQVDLNQTFAYSKTLAVRFADQDSLTLFPNPTHGPLTVKIPRTFVGELRLEITKNDGTPVLVKKYTSVADKSIQLNVAPLNVGVYTLSLEDTEGNRRQARLIRN